MGMVNKKGLVKIAEAIIAVLLVLGGLLIVASKQDLSSENALNENIRQILEEIAVNPSFREGILENPTPARIIDELKLFVRQRVNTATTAFEIKICGLNDACLLDSAVLAINKNEIYSAERVISSSRTCRDCDPRKIKIFLWRKS